MCSQASPLLAMFILFSICNTLADFGVVNMHHVGLLCENLERSLDFYQNLLGNSIFCANHSLSTCVSYSIV